MTTNYRAFDEDVLRITRIRAKNYRSIRELDLELGPLTVLVGPNASGKSNVLDVLRFFRDVFRLNLDSAISQRHGMEGIRHRSRGGRRRDVELGFSATIRDFDLEYSFVLTGDSNGGYRVKREYGSYKLDRESKRVDFDIREGQVIKPKAVVEYIFRLNASSTSGTEHFHPEDLAFFKYYGNLVMFDGVSEDILDRMGSWAIGHHRLTDTFSRLGLYQVSPNTIREPQVFMNSDLLNESGSNLASVLREMQNYGKDHLIDFGDLREALKQVIPGIVDVRSVPVGGYLVLQFRHSNISSSREVWLDASQESDGTLRMLALLTAIYRRPSSPLGIEEPELAIHPGVLGVLTDVLREASLRTQIIITTHSPDLIDRFPIECIRAVEFVDGETKVGEVSNRQASAVKERLFTLGELHSMEGLEINSPVAQ